MKVLSLEEIKNMSVPDFTDRLFHTAREYHRMRKALENIFTQWDKLGEYKDDDFGTMNEAIELAREVLKESEGE